MGGIKSFEPSRDIPSLEGKIICITGGTAGLGRTSILALAAHNPARIYFTGRNESAASSVIVESQRLNPHVPLTFLPCDFTSLSSVRAGLRGFTDSKLDILICNAGIMAQPIGLSAEGYEIHFAVNHLANALIVRTLLPRLLEAAQAPGADVRIVMLTSVGWRAHPSGGVRFDTIRSVQDHGFGWTWRRYGQSKLANIVHAAELARRYGRDGIVAVSVHPGVVSTPLVGNLPAARKALVYAANPGNVVSPEQGAKNQLWAAAGGKRDDLVNGAFYLPVGELAQCRLDDVAKSEKFAEELWDWTEGVLREFV